MAYEKFFNVPKVTLYFILQLHDICDMLQCNITDVVEFIPDKKEETWNTEAKICIFSVFQAFFVTLNDSLNLPVHETCYQ